METKVTRGRVLLLLKLLLVGSGAVCVALSAAHTFAQTGEMMLGYVFGAALLLVGSAVGVSAALSWAREHHSLIAQLKTAVKRGQLVRLSPPTSDSVPFTRAVNELLEAAEKTVADSLLRVKELEIQLKVATAERQHAEAIIYSISDAVLVTDPFDDLVLANESAARTFEFELENASRSPVDRVLQDQKVIELIREMRQSNSKSGRRIVEHAIKTAQGDRTFKITLSCVSGQKGPNGESEASGGVVAVLHDMTREKEVAEMKNDFVSNVSHELRTPLASIKAYVEMLIDGEADDEKTKREFYDVIQNEANRLSRLIDNILNISRIESGLVKINKQPQSLAVIMKEAIEVISPQARGKQISITEQLTPVFYQTLGDKDMLYQAVLNLMSNAVKYTREGGTIVVQTQVDEAKKKVVAKIIDSGVGIPPKDLPFVFDKFYRAGANDHMAKGTGLGLSLVKHIIETVHHGQIFVESTVGKGTTFGFELDLHE
jgi:two-component system phosphate regulon sensor histidine kinase PhoR